MQAVVKTPRTEITIRGEIPARILTALKSEYGVALKISKDDTENIFETGWYKDIKAKTTPGDTMRTYREIHGYTQARLGELLGKVPRQHISNMECGRRNISLNTAKKLSVLFKIPVDRFV
jgi:DNA-binding XRE family transcriptional regulator